MKKTKATKHWIETCLNDQSCESCHERAGILNSWYMFNSPESEPDCGDWVCGTCEETAEQAEHDPRNCPCGCEGDETRCVYAAKCTNGFRASQWCSVSFS